MLSYLDKTFCAAKHCDNFETCDRALTPEVLKAAHAWWKGPNAPISVFSNPEELECFEPEVPIELDD